MKKFILFTFFLPVLSHSYPQFVSYGYRSCLTCHYNPMGNGPLNDYGRAVAATAISARHLISDKTTDEELGSKSNFFYGALNKNTWFRPSIDYRGLYLQNDLNKDSKSNRFIHMQGALSVVLKTKRNKALLAFDIGYAPVPRNSDKPNWRTREHYLGLRPSKKLGIYVGMMDIAYGIRLVDHTAFSRRLNNLSQNDQTHGLLLHYQNKKFEIGLHGFLGNLLQDSELRQTGVSSNLEYSITRDFHLGTSVLFSSSSFKEQLSYASHLRYAFGKGFSVLGELGIKNEKFNAESEGNSSLYGMLRTQTLIVRGLFLNGILDYLRQDVDDEASTYRLGLGAQYFPAQRIEFRFDFVTTRSYGFLSSTGATRLSSDSLDVLSQVHIYL